MSSAPTPAGRPAGRAGAYSLLFGALAVLSGLVPVIGDLVSVPAAVVAIICGVVGVGHHDAGRTPRLLPSLLGALLGGVALLLTVVSLLAIGAPD